jgi:hypothetical protein
MIHVLLFKTGCVTEIQLNFLLFGKHFTIRILTVCNSRRFRSVEYDISKVVKELHESGLLDMTPYWCGITVHLLKTGKISHGSVLGEVMKANDYKDPWYAISKEYWDETLKKWGLNS